MKRLVIVVIVFIVWMFFGLNSVYAVCGGNREECCNRVWNPSTQKHEGTCNSGLFCHYLAGVCVKSMSSDDPTLPMRDPGTCTWGPRDMSSKECPIVTNNCNIKTGWNVKALTSEQKNFGECPPCQCGPIDGYEKDTCRAEWNRLAKSWARFWVVDGYNFCSDEKEAEIYESGMLFWYDVNCRCIVKGSQHSDDWVGSGRIIADPDVKKTGSSETNKIVLKGVEIEKFCLDKTTQKPSETDPRIRTALGCLPVTINGFIGWIVPSLFGVIGGIAFLIMIYGFIMMSTSEGDPKKAAAAKETITAAITGLILSIFAIFLVRLIMLYILRLPGVK
jgi:hypothetical protein